MHKTQGFWKNIALFLLAVAGFLYAIPNLYSEDPVIQISGEKPVSSEIETQVETLLKDKNVPIKSISTEDGQIEIRFPSTDSQLLAQDVIKHTLDSSYTIALNLAPATPNWLRAIGALPMKQGLDLRGGVHLLLEVDTDSIEKRRYEGLMKYLGQGLRETGIRYAAIRYFPKKGVVILFRTEEVRRAALSYIKNMNEDYVVTAAPDEMAVVVKLSDTAEEALRQNTIEQTMSILRNRVNELGVGEAVVQQQGARRIAVDLPGLQDAARAKQILGGTATLEFHLVDESSDPAIVRQTGIVPVSSRLYFMDGHPILLKRQVVLSGDAITSAVSSFDQQSASNAVQIQLGGGGEALFTRVTRDNVGHRMAIVFVETKTDTKTVDGVEKREMRRVERVISAPVIQNALGTNFQITGMQDGKEASNLALLLRAGALPAVIYPVEERTVGPSLGKENIRRGMVSLEVGMGLILILTIMYYRFFGIVANIALFLNLILLAALLSFIGTTLTLPGIAAFVLTVGMAVDANVLIYERIREELRAGLSPQAAISAGYDRAFATIMDANVTTLIVGVVLFAVGTGPVRGFAIILSLGLLTSMLTSVTYTRAIVDWYYGGRNVKKLSIGI